MKKLLSISLMTCLATLASCSTESEDNSWLFLFLLGNSGGETPAAIVDETNSSPVPANDPVLESVVNPESPETEEENANENDESDPARTEEGEQADRDAPFVPGTDGDDSSDANPVTEEDTGSSIDETSEGDGSVAGSDESASAPVGATAEDEGDNSQSESSGESDQNVAIDLEEACPGARITLDTSDGKWNTGRGNGNAGPVGIYTFWARQKLYVTVSGNCRPGFHALSLKARNIFGPLPGNYDQFVVNVRDRDSGESFGPLFVEASDTGYRTGAVAVFLNEGETNLEIVWTNDAYRRGKYDANFQLHSLRIKTVE